MRRLLNNVELLIGRRSCAIGVRLRLIHCGILFPSLGLGSRDTFCPLRLVYLSIDSLPPSSPVMSHGQTVRVGKQPSRPRVLKRPPLSSSPDPSIVVPSAAPEPARAEGNSGILRTRRPEHTPFSDEAFQRRRQPPARPQIRVVRSTLVHPIGAPFRVQGSRPTSTGRLRLHLKSPGLIGAKPDSQTGLQAQTGHVSLTAPLRPTPAIAAQKQARPGRRSALPNYLNLNTLQPIRLSRAPGSVPPPSLALSYPRRRLESGTSALLARREPLATRSQALDVERSTELQEGRARPEVCRMRRIGTLAAPVARQSRISARTSTQRKPPFPPLALSFGPTPLQSVQSPEGPRESSATPGPGFERTLSPHRQAFPTRHDSQPAKENSSRLISPRDRPELPDLRLLADRVYEQIAERIRREKESAGIKTYA